MLVFKKTKKTNINDTIEKLQSFLDENSAEPVKFLTRFWGDQQQAITYKEIRELLLSGEVSESVISDWQQDYSALTANYFVELWKKSMKGGAFVVDGLVFDIDSPNIAGWVEKYTASFVTRVTQDQTAAINQLIKFSMNNKYNVDEMARVIRPCIGLTEQQATANMKYYLNVKQNLRQANPNMWQTTVEKKARESALKHAAKEHRKRAFTIAETEISFMFNHGGYQSILQAQSEGLLGHMRKTWVSADNERTCSTCKALDGVTIEMDESFDFKGRVLCEGHKLCPPAHPRCNCGVKYEEVV